MNDLSERCIFQLVGTTLAIMPMTIQIPLVPNLKPLCEEDHCRCSIQGIVLLVGFVANAIALSVCPLRGDPTFEKQQSKLPISKNILRTKEQLATTSRQHQQMLKIH